MIKNYIVTTFRNFLRNGNYSLINIFGLSTGITACIIIFLLVSYDLNFDKFHSKYESIYRITQTASNSSGEEHNSSTPYPAIKAFRNDFPEIPLATQIHFQEEVLLRVDDQKFIVENAVFADSLFFDVFDFEVVEGNPKAELGQPGKVFLTESLARKIGYRSTQGNPLRVKIENRVDAEVVGIVKDAPADSHMQFSIIISMPSLTGDFIGGMPLDHWPLTASAYAYIVLPPNITPASVEERFKKFVEKYYSKEDAARRKFMLQPLSKIHFDEQFTSNPSPLSNASYKELMVLSLLGIFILLIACINFINLSTALAMRKAKEIGIRKTLGAKRSQLTWYFLIETFIVTLVAVLISLGIAEWLTPWINGFIQKKISLDLFTNSHLVVFILALILFTTLFSGFYPSMVLSGYNPASVLKNKITGQSSGGGVRKVLVVFQFMIAQVLIIGTLIISDQMSYFKTKQLGFDKEAIIVISLPQNKKETLQALRDRLQRNDNISSISFSLGAPTSDNNFGTNFFLTEAKSKEIYDIGVKPVDRHYRDTYGIKLKAGRWFTESEEKVAEGDLPKDQKKYVYILNESAVKRLGFHSNEEIIGKFITTGIYDINAEVIGVVSDFHSSSLHNEIAPVVLLNFPYFYYEAGIKVTTSNLAETIKFIEKEWSDLYPDYYFEYAFLDQVLEELYRNDERTFTLMKIFAGISIFIGCLGLYGLVSFLANQKVKEVGIRKVLGASVQSIVLLFSSDFIKLIIIAFAIAAPLGWYFMNQWLETFAYHISIHWSVFVISIVITLLIALLTVSYRSIRAAITNPSDVLRTE